MVISLVSQGHATMYLKEIIHLLNPNLYRWRFIFLKAFVLSQKESKPSRIMFTNILSHVTKEESRCARIVKTSFRVWLRTVK